MVQITMLNSMADLDFQKSLDTHVQWGLSLLDLKDYIFGKSILELSNEEAVLASEMIHERSLRVYCLSTTLFYEDIEQGEQPFRASLEQVSRAVEIARILRPSVIRLLAPRSTKRLQIAHSVDYVNHNYPWLFSMYRDAIDVINDAGFGVTIENEVHGCLLGNENEVLAFFDSLQRENEVSFTYDVQNLWQMGTYPTEEVVRTLSPLVRYLHVKGGISVEGRNELYWSSGLEDASWDVSGVLYHVLSHGNCNVICLNTSHGHKRAGYRYEEVTKRDLAYVRARLREFDRRRGDRH